MKSKLLIFMAIIAISPTLSATKIYKVVDEDGNVTYSQVPPRKTEESTAKVEALRVDGGAMTRVTARYGREYCGDIRLPSRADTRNASPGRYSKDVESSLEEWRSLLFELTEYREQSDYYALQENRRSPRSSTYENEKTARYQERFTDDTQRMRDLRCAIDWAEGKRDEVTTYKIADQEEKARLQSVADELEGRLYRKCGEQPEYDPADRHNKEDRARWYNCGRDLIRDLNAVNRRIRGY